MRFLSQPSSFGTVPMLLLIVRCGNRPDLLDDVADLAAQLRLGLAHGRSCRRCRMSPLVSSIIRLTRRMAVVLPQPDGPTSTHTSPAGTVKERLSMAGVLAPGYALADVLELQRARRCCPSSSTPARWSVFVTVTNLPEAEFAHARLGVAPNSERGHVIDIRDGTVTDCR